MGDTVNAINDGAVHVSDTIKEFATKEKFMCGKKTVTDGIKCGWDYFDTVAKCGADAAKCGVEKIASGAECGFGQVTSVAQCGLYSFACEKTIRNWWDCVNVYFAPWNSDGYCKIDATCEDVDTCFGELECDVAKPCDTPVSCKEPKKCSIPESC